MREITALPPREVQPAHPECNDCTTLVQPSLVRSSGCIGHIAYTLAMTNSPSANDDADLRDVNPRLPKIAAGFTLLAGAVAILNAVQTLTSVRISSAWLVMPYVLIAAGVGLIFLARKVFTARGWAAIGVLAAGSLLALLSAVWLVFAVSHGFIALYAIWTPVFSLVAVVMCGVSLPACDRAERARRSLAAQGLSIGI